MIYYYQVAILGLPLPNFTYSSDEKLKIGQQVNVKIRSRKNLTLGVIITQEKEKPDFKCTKIAEILDFYYDDIMMETASFISKYYVCKISQSLNLYTPHSSMPAEIKTIEDEKIENNIKLSQMQQKALEFCDKNPISLLFADTGSGKTEIYIKAITNVINNGDKQALFLIPEISLTPQMEKRLKLIFGDKIAIWHSKITKKNKQIVLDNLKSKQIKIIVGTRSALFLPYTNLGIIIVDEEHDESYKSNATPMINVKDLSIYMAKKYSIQIILGTATPSLPIYSKIPYFRIKQKFHNSKNDIIFDNIGSGLNDFIIQNIKQTLQNKKQIIIFVPTRANFKYQICDFCGDVMQCPFCSVGLSLYKNNKVLKCNYCNFTQKIVEQCPSCQSGIIKNFRIGTTEVVQQLQAELSDTVIQQFDRDNVSTNKQLKTILKSFDKNEIDILVGTQMLTKGHDYPNVALVVVLGIDSLLNISSYKTKENIISLLIQISGRGGRSEDGKVIIQTKNEELFEDVLINNNYEEFLEDELDEREEFYPPSCRVARVVFSHKNETIARNELDYYVNIFKNLNEVTLIGYGQSGIFKISNKFRYELLLRSKNTNKLLNALHQINSSNALIDMDTLY